MVGDPPDVPGFAVGVPIGYGGFAAVWRAASERTGESVAIKVAHAAGDLLAARFEREAEILAQIGPPHVPVFHAHGRLPDGRPYVVMEELCDATLASHLAGLARPPDIVWLCDVADAVLAALEAVHGHGVVHRDLKPENVFLAESLRQARLVDFGIAKDLGRGSAALTRTGIVVGSSEYIAPEQLTGQVAVDLRADVYSFGVLLYELLTLRVPFTGDRASVERGHLLLRPPRPSHFARVSEPLEQLCLACLAKDRERRPPNVTSLRRELARLWQSKQASGPAGGVSSPSTTLLTDARQPVVLLTADFAEPGVDVHAVVTPRKGVVARQWGRRQLCAFSGLMTDDPMQAAVSAARVLHVDSGGRLAIHLARLKVRHTDGNPPLKIYGRAAEKPETWMPDGDWTGVVFTRHAAQIAPPGHAERVAGSAFYRLRSEPLHQDRDAALVGRDDVIAAAEGSLRGVVDDETPGLLSLFGEAGLGKSRLARACTRLAGRHSPSITTCRFRAVRGTGAEDSSFLGLLDKLALYVPEVVGARGAAELAAPRGERLPDMRSLADALLAAARSRPFALILDDAHHADDATLDAIEYATLDREGSPLWVVVTAHPRLERRRPQWGRRAHRHDRVVLEPLADASGKQLAAALLHPAEYTPAETLLRLTRWAGGNPQLLAELVRALERGGVVRKRPETGSWYVATAELDKLPASPLGEWLAMRTASALPVELAACARLCSILGEVFTVDEVEWIQDAAERTGAASTPVDAAVGLRQLEQDHGLLRRVRARAFTFRQPALRDAIYKSLSTKDSAALHAHAFEYWRRRAEADDADAALSAVARHAAAAGEVTRAIAAYLELGDRSSTRHRHVAADEHYTAALELMEGDDLHRRLRALSGRGRALYHMQRNLDAVDDLVAARDIADQLDDAAARAELFLEEATALDWSQDYESSAQRVEDARPFVESSGDSRLRARYTMALGRSRLRAERLDEAVALLQESVERAASLDDHETRVAGLLLLGPALVITDQLESAEERYEEVIGICANSGDKTHLAAAFCNRVLLWSRKRLDDDSARDLLRAIELAREIGHPVVEAGASHNLAEIFHWSGNTARALALARRASVLSRRFLPQTSTAHALLLARIHAVRGEHDQARSCVRAVRAQPGHERGNPITQLMLDAVDLLLDSSQVEADAWDAVLRDARAALPAYAYLEVLYLHGRWAATTQRWPQLAAALERAAALLGSQPIWQNNFDALLGELPRLHAEAGTSSMR